VRGVGEVVLAVALEDVTRLERDRRVDDHGRPLGRHHVVTEVDRAEVLRVVEPLGRRHARRRRTATEVQVGLAVAVHERSRVELPRHILGTGSAGVDQRGRALAGPRTQR
jgi:hypothetical protein